jgi:uncharacterized membrane protein YraQ (UPF0718 family)
MITLFLTKAKNSLLKAWLFNKYLWFVCLRIKLIIMVLCRIVASWIVAVMVGYIYPWVCTDTNQTSESRVLCSWPTFWHHTSVPGLSTTLLNTLSPPAAFLNCYRGVKTTLGPVAVVSDTLLAVGSFDFWMKVQLFGTMIKWNTEVCENIFLPIHCNMEPNVGYFLLASYMWTWTHVLQEATLSVWKEMSPIVTWALEMCSRVAEYKMVSSPSLSSIQSL